MSLKKTIGIAALSLLGTGLFAQSQLDKEYKIGDQVVEVEEDQKQLLDSIHAQADTTYRTTVDKLAYEKIDDNTVLQHSQGTWYSQDTLKLDELKIGDLLPIQQQGVITVDGDGNKNFIDVDLENQTLDSVNNQYSKFGQWLRRNQVGFAALTEIGENQNVNGLGFANISVYQSPDEKFNAYLVPSMYFKSKEETSTTTQEEPNQAMLNDGPFNVVITENTSVKEDIEKVLSPMIGAKFSYEFNQNGDRLFLGAGLGQYKETITTESENRSETAFYRADGTQPFAPEVSIENSPAQKDITRLANGYAEAGWGKGNVELGIGVYNIRKGTSPFVGLNATYKFGVKKQ